MNAWPGTLLLQRLACVGVNVLGLGNVTYKYCLNTWERAVSPIGSKPLVYTKTEKSMPLGAHFRQCTHHVCVGEPYVQARSANS